MMIWSLHLIEGKKTIYECNFLCAMWLGICRVGTEFATSLQGLDQWHHRASPYNRCLSSKVMKCEVYSEQKDTITMGCSRYMYAIQR